MGGSIQQYYCKTSSRFTSGGSSSSRAIVAEDETDPVDEITTELMSFQEQKSSDWGCFSCVGACWFGSRRGVTRTRSKGRQGLAELAEACDAAAAQPGALLRRSKAVAKWLIPVLSSAAFEALRPGGPRQHKVADLARRLREALEALGPAYVKLGQALASREDILNAEAAAELKKLCDQVPPFSKDEVIMLLRSEGLAEEMIEAVEAAGDSVAAASLGQVYRVCLRVSDSLATPSSRQPPSSPSPRLGWCNRRRLQEDWPNLKNCETVELAVKVQRPGLAEAVAIDVLILRRLARSGKRLLRRISPARLDLEQVITTWAKTLWQELDYDREATCMELMRNSLCIPGTAGHVPGLVIPRVCWAHSTSKILVTEWINGAKVTESPERVQVQHIQTGVETYAAMVLDIGLVHADPHAGNLLITEPGNEVCLLDFGMVVAVPQAHRRVWAECVVKLVTGNYDGVFDCLVKIGFFPATLPREEIMPMFSKLWSEFVAAGSSTVRRKTLIRSCYGEIKSLVKKVDFDLPDYYLALVRALLTLEGIALSADCEFDIFQAAFPVAVRALATSTATSRTGSIALTAASALRTLTTHPTVAASGALGAAALLIAARVLLSAVTGGAAAC